MYTDMHVLVEGRGTNTCPSASRYIMCMCMAHVAIMTAFISSVFYDAVKWTAQPPDSSLLMHENMHRLNSYYYRGRNGRFMRNANCQNVNPHSDEVIKRKEPPTRCCSIFSNTIIKQKQTRRRAIRCQLADMIIFSVQTLQRTRIYSPSLFPNHNITVDIGIGISVARSTNF